MARDGMIQSEGGGILKYPWETMFTNVFHSFPIIYKLSVCSIPYFGMNPHWFLATSNNDHQTMEFKHPNEGKIDDKNIQERSNVGFSQESLTMVKFCMNSVEALLAAALRNISCPAPWGDAWHSAYSGSARIGTHVLLHTHKHTQTHTHTHPPMHACTYARTHARTHSRTHAHTHTPTRAHAHAHAHAHTHTHTLQALALSRYITFLQLMYWCIYSYSI